MARRLRMESETGVYHVYNRGNYRWDLFRDDGAKAAFLRCLEETCNRTGWVEALRTRQVLTVDSRRRPGAQSIVKT